MRIDWAEMSRQDRMTKTAGVLLAFWVIAAMAQAQTATIAID